MVGVQHLLVLLWVLIGQPDVAGPVIGPRLTVRQLEGESNRGDLDETDSELPSNHTAGVLLTHAEVTCRLTVLPSSCLDRNRPPCGTGLIRP